MKQSQKQSVPLLPQEPKGAANRRSPAGGGLRSKHVTTKKVPAWIPAPSGVFLGTDPVCKVKDSGHRSAVSNQKEQEAAGPTAFTHSR